jgi:hypothetical protein
LVGLFEPYICLILYISKNRNQIYKITIMRDLTEVEKLVRIIDNSVELEKETHKVS